MKTAEARGLAARMAAKKGVKIAWKAAQGGGVAEALLVMLEEIAVLENPVYRHSPKLRALADGLRGTPLHQRELVRLREFLKTASSLNIEGYITFRMVEYREKLDMVAYTLIKKMNLAKKGQNTD